MSQQNDSLKGLHNQYIIKSQCLNLSKLTCYIHFFFIPTLLAKTYHGSKILQFNTGSTFLSKIHISFYCQDAKFSNAVEVP